MGKCLICSIVKVLAGLGAFNWLLVAWLDVNIVASLLGDMTMPAKIVYTLIGISGAMVLMTLVKSCPCCKKK